MPNLVELGPIIGQVETDTFCEGCGYNLHTQAVVRDERLGILVCRCPECGRFAAAGRTTSAARTWLNRLGTVLLTTWVLFLLGLFGLCTLFLGMVAYGHMVTQTTVQNDPHPPNSYGYSYHYVRRTAQSIDEERERHLGQIYFACIAGSLGMLTGGLFTVLLWHCKGWRRSLALLPPLVGCGAAALIWEADSMSLWLRGWGLGEIAAYALLEMVAAAIGVWIGRPVARALLKILVPPKARQHLAFLWIVDGLHGTRLIAADSSNRDRIEELSELRPQTSPIDQAD